MQAHKMHDKLQALRSYLDHGPDSHPDLLHAARSKGPKPLALQDLSYPFSLVFFDLLIRQARSRSIPVLENLRILFQKKRNRLNKRHLETIEPILGEIIQLARIPQVIDEKEPTRPLRILFLQDSPCIRNYKYAAALQQSGHKITLAYIHRRLAEAHSLDEEVYEDVLPIKDFETFWDLSEDFDLVHSHNEPDLYTVLALGSTRPVIHDTHDLISLRPETRSYETNVLESLANTLALGRITVSPYLLEQLDARYGPSYETVIYNYALPDTTRPDPSQKLSAKDNKVHIVYQGGLVLGHSYRDPSDLFIELSQRGYQVHIYPAQYFEEARRLFAPYPNIHHYKPVSPSELVTELTKYDLGIIPLRVTDQTREILNASLGNKLFEYIAAGLPVLAPELVSYEGFFREHRCGLTYRDTEDLIGKIPVAMAMKKPEKRFLFQDQVERLLAFYQNCMARNEYRKRLENYNHLKRLYRRNIYRWIALLRRINART